MPWRKDRPYASGELEFKLGGGPSHSDDWLRKRAARLDRKHHHER